MADEPKLFPPSPEFQKNAYYSSMEQYEADYKRSVEDPEGYWADRAKDALVWTKDWDKVLEWSFDPVPFIKWFQGGELNASYNCLDRHVEAGKGDKKAIIFEGDPGDTYSYTYKELLDEVSKFANVLKKHGVKKGDRVALYLPMIAELPIVMLACARIGAIHMMVFGGFSAEALKARIDNCGAKVLVCADKGHRGSKNTPSKTNADAAIAGETTVEKVIVIKRVDGDVPMTEGRDVWFHDEMAAPDISAECEPVPVDAEHPLFILYTSGSTGTPKGVLHSTGGFLLYAHDTTKYVFNLHDDDIHFCTADIGWITGHSYIVYGPLALGATSILFEGLPTYPEPDRYWQVVEKHQATTIYTAPTVIRSLIGQGDEWPEKHPMPSLRMMALRGRAHRPEQLAVVPRQGRQGREAALRHVVADGDRRPHDHPAAGRLHPQAGLGQPAVLRHPDHRAQGQRRSGRRRRGRSPLHQGSVAGHDPRHVGRRRGQALQRGLLLHVQGPLLHR